MATSPDRTTTRADRLWPSLVTVGVVLFLVAWATWATLHFRGLAELELDGAGAPPHTAASVLAGGGSLFPVHVHRPQGSPRVVVGEDPRTGAPLTASCTTCHATRRPDPDHGRTKALDDFHTEIAFQHGAGALGCLSCHDPADYDSLRGADGRRIAYADVMEMCAQCHGRQYESYQHGAHGGMNGYWDLSRGPRARHTCTDCHDPHAPAFPSMKPTFKPIDRGLEGSGTSAHE